MPSLDLDQEIKELIIDVLQLEDIGPADIDAAAKLSTSAYQAPRG